MRSIPFSVPVRRGASCWESVQGSEYSVWDRPGCSVRRLLGNYRVDAQSLKASICTPVCVSVDGNGAGWRNCAAISPVLHSPRSV